MSKFTGGIFSKASGKMSGIIFSRARTKNGMVMTAKEYAEPMNPQTLSQSNNRLRFAAINQMILQTDSQMWKNELDRATGQLPGYQSLMSNLLKYVKVDGDFESGLGPAVGNDLLWETGTIDNGNTDNKKIIVTLNPTESEFPPGTTIYVYGIQASTGDWRDLQDNQTIFYAEAFEAAQAQIVADFDLAEEITGVSLIGFFLSNRDGLFSLMSRGRNTRTPALEIQDIHNKG